MTYPPSEQYTILWAEDDPDDQGFFQMAFDKIGSQFRCQFVRNGMEVLSFLEPLPKEQLPCLIVLDINMPLMDGIDTLKCIKSDDRYRAIPAVVVSTAQSGAVRETLSKFQVAFRSKPDSVPELVELVLELLLLAGMSF